MGETSGYAIASLILGIISLIIGWIPIFGWIFIILALIFGFTALKKIKNNHNITGRGLAIAGIVMGLIPLVITLLITLLVGLSFFGNREPTKFLPDRCDFGSEIVCKDSAVTTSDVSLRLVNNIGSNINVTNFTMMNPDGFACTKKNTSE